MAKPAWAPTLAANTVAKPAWAPILAANTVAKPTWALKHFVAKIYGKLNGVESLCITRLNVITVAAVRSSAATLTGELASKPMEMMLDSGSAVSLVRKEEADKLQDKLTNIPIPQVRLVTASGSHYR